MPRDWKKPQWHINPEGIAKYPYLIFERLVFQQQEIIVLETCWRQLYIALDLQLSDHQSLPREEYPAFKKMWAKKNIPCRFLNADVSHIGEDEPIRVWNVGTPEWTDEIDHLFVQLRLAERVPEYMKTAKIDPKRKIPLNSVSFVAHSARSDPANDIHDCKPRISKERAKAMEWAFVGLSALARHLGYQVRNPEGDEDVIRGDMFARLIHRKNILEGTALIFYKSFKQWLDRHRDDGNCPLVGSNWQIVAAEFVQLREAILARAGAVGFLRKGCSDFLIRKKRADQIHNLILAAPLPEPTVLDRPIPTKKYLRQFLQYHFQKRVSASHCDCIVRGVASRMGKSTQCVERVLHLLGQAREDDASGDASNVALVEEELIVASAAQESRGAHLRPQKSNGPRKRARRLEEADSSSPYHRKSKRSKRQVQSQGDAAEHNEEATVDHVPCANRDMFYKIYFASWGKSRLPVWVVNPFDVESGPARKQWMEKFTDLKDKDRLQKVPNLCFWLGTEDMKWGYSLLPTSHLTPYEKGIENKYHILPAATQKKLDNGKALTKAEAFHCRALAELEEYVD